MDEIEVEILEDGTISIKTDAVGDTNHISADKLLDMVSELAGGEVKRKENPDKKVLSFFKNKKVLRGGKIVTINK